LKKNADSMIRNRKPATSQCAHWW